MIHHFPFTAIVGQERLKQALLVNAVNPAVGGLLVEGPSGTGKSTAARGLARLLPEIEIVTDCPFSCSPEEPCPRCTSRTANGEKLSAARRPVRLVNLPLNATEDRVAGSIDVAIALRAGEKALEPGLLADANRGILYVDEINLLDDHLTDILLDAAALGTNIVEREGISIQHPSRFLLVGTMNPEEGELRPQIADRLGLHVVVQALERPADRAEVIRRREAFHINRGVFTDEFSDLEREVAEQVAKARERLLDVQVADPLYEGIGQLVVRTGVASHRADVTILECAKALAALDRRVGVSDQDVVEAAGLALGHRLESDPFEPATEIDDELLTRLLEEALEIGAEEKKAPNPAAPGQRTG